MAKTDPSNDASAKPASSGARGAASYLDMPADRRATAEATAATLVAAAQKVADELPLQTDVDDFRRILVSEG